MTVKPVMQSFLDFKIALQERCCQQAQLANGPVKSGSQVNLGR